MFLTSVYFSPNTLIFRLVFFLKRNEVVHRAGRVLCVINTNETVSPLLVWRGGQHDDWIRWDGKGSKKAVFPPLSNMAQPAGSYLYASFSQRLCSSLHTSLYVSDAGTGI